ncbi:MAG: efflux RND transporter permease subunit [Pyrinomonadaceae bacterium]
MTSKTSFAVCGKIVYSENPRSSLDVIYHASLEVRSSIVYATVIVALVFIPLFALTGVEGRLLAPLGLAYITSLVASLFVSLTVTPVLASYLLPKMKAMHAEKDSFIVRFLKKWDEKLLHRTLRHPYKVIIGRERFIFAGDCHSAVRRHGVFARI